MNGWRLQWYCTVPAIANVWVTFQAQECLITDGVLPDGFPSVTVCAVLSLFVRLTAVPLGMFIGEGL
jgi:hypothetical protein